MPCLRVRLLRAAWPPRKRTAAWAQPSKAYLVEEFDLTCYKAKQDIYLIVVRMIFGEQHLGRHCELWRMERRKKAMSRR